MKNLLHLASRAGATVLHRSSKHAPTILTTVGVVGSVASTVLAARATLQLPVQNKAFRANRNSIHDLHDAGYYSSTKSYQKDLTLCYAKQTLDLARIYGPAIGIGAASLVCIVSAHGLMVKREATLVGSLALVERGFNEYRKRVEGDPDVTEEKKLFYRHGEYELEETTDADGKKVKSVKFQDPAGVDIYARFFDESNPNWKGNPTMNLTFLRAQQRYANELLTARGHVFLNDIYDAMGFERTGPGAVTGWTLTGGPTGDNFIDFGLGDGSREAVRRFINKDEASVLLDFNVQGTIWNKI